MSTEAENTTTIGYKSCPGCSSEIEEREHVEVQPDQFGDPMENIGKALYCTNEDCDYYTNPVY